MEPWEPQFKRQEVWLFNTEYCLFGPDGVLVDEQNSHRSRLDEMAKALVNSPPSSATRMFWADGVVSVEGPELGKWMYWLGKKAPSEQQMVRYLVPNIEAAWHGIWRVRSFKEAREDYRASGEKAESTWPPERPRQPTPGVFAWRARRREGEDWSKWPEQADVGVWDHEWREGQLHWPLEPTMESAKFFLSSVRKNPRTSNRTEFDSEACELAVGMLLEYGGADLDFGSQFPRAPRLKAVAGMPDPSACVTMLGGPKGISKPFQDALRQVFRDAGVTLLEVCLGPQEEMAHVCLAHLRVMQDSLRFRASVVDLFRLGGSVKAYNRLSAAARRGAEEAAAAERETMLREDAAMIQPEGAGDGLAHSTNGNAAIANGAAAAVSSGGATNGTSTAHGSFGDDKCGSESPPPAKVLRTT